MKTNRWMALLLVLVLACGLTVPSGADVATLGISFCGVRTEQDGTERYIPLEGTFRVLYNGAEFGTIRAGRDTLTLPGTERVRIIPLPETIAPEWDLKTASQEVFPLPGGTTTVSVVVYPLKAEDALATPVPVTPAPEAETAQDLPQQGTATDGQPESPEGEKPEDQDMSGEASDEEEPVPAAAAATPTLPPYDPSLLAPTPEPAWITLPAGTGKVQAFAYLDQNENGAPGETERGIANVTVCLMTGEEEAISAQVTGADGLAVFEGIPEGEYRIKAILPQGYAFSKKGSGEDVWSSLFSATIDGEQISDSFTVMADSVSAPGIGLRQALHVSGQCWFETTADGLFKEGEPVLSGVKIELNGVKNGLHYETWSDENGNWRIDRVNPAFYDLTVTAPEGMMFARVSNRGGRRSYITKDGSSRGSRRMDLNDNESEDNIYLGFTWSGQVYGRCFLDANYNGVYDEGELPMAGVKITAIKQAKDEEVAVTYSGEDGTYRLNGLRGNTYKMRAVLPDDGSDFTRTVSDLLGNHFKSRPGRRENFWPDFLLAEAEQREMNVGVIYPGSITGTVYLDTDFSASMSGKEKIVSGYLVSLVDEQGNTVASDKTSIRGKYELTGLVPGTYSLSVEALKGYAFTKPGEGNVILNRTGGEGYSESFFLALGENRTGMDIGMIQPGTVEGTVFADRNDNGLRDEGEAGLPGVVVRLMGEDGEAFRAEIGEDGRYLFDAVMPGAYYLEYQLPENAIFASTVAGGNTVSGENGVGRGESFSFASGDHREGALCGALTLGRVEGVAWQDHDGDGKQGPGEASLSGMKLTLTPSRPDLAEASVTTAEDGSFLLSGLHPDTYTLTVECPGETVLSRMDYVRLPLVPGRATQSVSLPVAMGEVWEGQQLGAVIPAGISGQVWLDENNNGRFDEGERTPAGYEITVTDDLTGNVFDTLITDGEGRYATWGMIPGSFTLSCPLDENTVAPKPGDSVFTEMDGRLVAPAIELGEKENREGMLLGIVKYTAIGGTVWIDRGDAIENLAGAEISLLDESGAVLASRVTSDAGAYRFDGLMPGTYTLSATMPEGCVIIEPDDPRLTGGQSSVIAHPLNRTGTTDPIVLTMSDDRLQMNVGCVLPGRLGDFCWLDLDGDGLQGMNEPGIPYVKIELMRGDRVVAETESDQYGFYRLEDLYPAAYTLRVTMPKEVKPTVRRTDIRLIASVLEETEEATAVSVSVQVESDRANYNADLGFVLRQQGVLPAGVYEGKTQVWTSSFNSED